MISGHGTPKAQLMCQRAAHKAISIDKYELFYEIIINLTDPKLLKSSAEL